MPMNGGGGASEKPMPMGSSGGGGDKPMPMNGGSGGTEQKPDADGGTGKKTGGEANPNGSGTGKKGLPSLLPNEDPFTKQVWGQLPDKLRQQAMQSYREQFMPRYNDLLKQYYNNLAEQEKAKKKTP